MRKLYQSFIIIATISLLFSFPSQSFAQTSDHSCVSTIEHLLAEMAAGRTYIQFHTNNDIPPTNTGPGDLQSPGEIRANISPSHHEFTGTADKSQNVFSHGTDPTPWQNVEATADLKLTHDTSGHHPVVNFEFTVNELDNVVGIHMHNGAPGESSTLHLVDFLTDSNSLIDNISHGPVDMDDATYTGTITASDVCPTSHGHSHDPAPSCVSTIEHLLAEMAAGRTYIQFHTNNDIPPTNTGPGDLQSPGEIRANISPSHHEFTGTADKSQNVFSHGTDPTPWQNVEATADLKLTHDTSGHHPVVNFEFTVNELDNVVGIHMHNGAPGESSTLHLVDFLTEHGSLIDNISHGPVDMDDATYTGTITASDICPTSHGHTHEPSTFVITNPIDQSNVTPTPVISGVADPGVFVSVTSGTVLGTTTSNSMGLWSLSVTEPLNTGTHMLMATMTDGNGNSSNSPHITVTVIDSLGSISGTVFADVSGDGKLGTNEVGISTMIYAIPATNPQLTMQTVSGADGRFLFSNLIPDEYLIQVTVPEDHTYSPGFNFFSRQTVSADAHIVTDFPLQKINASSTSSVSGVVFSDTNSNGMQDIGEPGIPGVAILTIDLLTASATQTTTDSTGSYTINGIVPSRTIIQASPIPIGYSLVDGYDFFRYVDPSTIVNFPLNKITPEETATITGTIHEDDNANGIYDREAGFPGIKVHLIELSTGRTLTTTTDLHGQYTFTGILPDMVLVQTGLIDEDHLPQIGYSTFQYVQLDAGQNTINFPMRHIHPENTAIVSGMIYSDANSNGVKDADEHGISNILVTVTALTTGQQEQIHTDNHGNFTIPGVMPDKVLVEIQHPTGYTPTTSNNGFEYVILSDGQTKNIMFGFHNAHNH